ncbi:hypothetical protein G0Q06_13095 [Puniceicoccales bacterium CK1056]|uniref:Uncharacterized protein n=1 Tax=Oceanipulchritudo coccoides TaxID=2706888 RepID=A0A6B2M6G5_9BACT|nr:hypothetical protein [Oceanipulchritudo coccoides]NDV63395.1 hypothetical protein [Oceanipulchritudo coccoides]
MSQRSACLIKVDPSSAQGEQWKPNKEDCDQLAKRWNNYYNSQPGRTTYDTDNQALVAAGIETAVRAEADDWNGEYGGSVYQVGEGYSFTKPTGGFGGSWSIVLHGYRTWFKDNIAFYHNHPLGKGIASENFSMGERRSDNAFVHNKEMPLLLVTPALDMRILGPNDDNGFTKYFDPIGRDLGNIEGAPSGEEVNKIIQCRNEGF